MFILEVHLENFLSFGSATLALHPHLNVLVGKNGSGKSNLVEAVAFVLQGTKFDPQGRRHIIHEEAASKRKTRPVATVRLLIDNSDRRLAVNEDTVVVARTMGPVKEDTLTLQGRKIHRDELQGLLESAGFSRFNPYYIVRQGQVSHLSSCTDRRRLEVVRELTGERGFDSSRGEADKRMTVTREEMEEIDAKIEEMSVRMEELDADNAQLRRYLKEQRMKRAIEFVLAEKQSDLRKEAQNKLEGEIQEIRPKVAESLRNLALQQDLRSEWAREREALVQKERKERAFREETQADLERQDQKIAELETRLEAYKEEIGRVRKRVEECKKDMKAVDREISLKEAELEEAEDAFGRARAAYNELELEKASKEKLQSNLYGAGAAGGSGDYRSEEEREERVRARRADLEATWTREQGRLNELQAQIDQSRAKIAECVQDSVEFEQAMSEVAAERESIMVRLSNAEKELSAVDRDLAELLRDKNRRLAQRASLEETLRCSEIRLMKMRGVRPHFTGMKSLEVVIDSLTETESGELLPKILGTVADNINRKNEHMATWNLVLSEELGVKLFGVIVRDADTAARLLAKMKALRLPGEIFFLPADKLRDEQKNRPPLPKGCKLLLDFVEYGDDPAVLKAMRFHLGKTALVRDASCFPELQRLGLHAITLDGTKGSNKGVIRGGYLRPKASLLDLYEDYKDAKDKVEEAGRVEDLDARLDSAVRSKERLASDVQKEKTKLDRVEAQLGVTREKRNSAQRYRVEYADSVRQAEDAAHRIRCSLKEVEADLSALKSTGGNGARLSTQACVDLAGELKQLKQRHRVAFQAMNRTERRMVEVKNALQESLYKRRADIEDVLCNSDQVELSARASTANEERDNAVQTRMQLREDLDRADKGMSEAVRRRLALDKQDEKQRVSLDRATSAHDEARSELAKKEAKLATLTEATAEARAFQGTVPGEEIDKVKGWSHSKLVSEAKRVDRALKKFKGVNTMATEEFNRLEEALARFNERRDKCIKDHDELSNLLENLEEKRLTKVHYTYSQMKKYFSEIFKELVPEGEAKMTFVQGSTQHSSGGDADITGLSLGVRFEGDDMLSDILHLSGGQKAVVALAFVFAVQKCDPAPFFILDEVDAALDSRHRRRVVEFMRKQADRQFVCTTFRREFLSGADRFVAVSYGQKESRLRQVERAEAEQFIARQEEESQLRREERDRAKKAKKRKQDCEPEEEDGSEQDGEGSGNDCEEQEEPIDED